MAIIKPFKAIRPNKDWAKTIAALPYDVYNRKEAKEEVKKHPHSFLEIDRPETSFDDNFDMYSIESYAKAKEILDKWISEKSLVMDDKPCYYIYELVMEGRSQTGLVACASIDDYINNVIKKHENTRADKELDRINHVDICDAQTGPIFLTYRSDETINNIVNSKKQEKPLYDFTNDDGVTHRCWIIDEDDDISRICEAFSRIESLYIADGHHRCASACKVGIKRRNEADIPNPSAEYNFFLSVIFPDKELKILDYNRVVKDLNGLNKDEFKEKLSEVFEYVGEESDMPIKPANKGEVSLLLDGKWQKLKFKAVLDTEDPVEDLDVYKLQKYVLDSILDIKDPKTDNRIDFIGGIRGLGELERRCKEDCKIAFAMYPTSIDELFAVADNNRLMPPKSTWFEPKLRSGLFIHDISINGRDIL